MIVSVVMRRAAKILAPVAVLSVVLGCSQEVDMTPAFPDIPASQGGGAASKKPAPNMDRMGSEQGKPNP